MFASHLRKLGPGFLAGTIGGGLIALLAMLSAPPVQDALLFSVVPVAGMAGAILENWPHRKLRWVARMRWAVKTIFYGALGTVGLWLCVLLFATVFVIVAGPLAVVAVLVATYKAGQKRANSSRVSPNS